MIPATDANESERLEALHELALLETEPEPEFDELVALAAAVCDTPIGIISLIDEKRQWFKAAQGLDMKETPRSIAFCDHSIRQNELFVVEDAEHDARFADNPLVLDDHIRFYAGMPVAAPDGHAVGTLCVLDKKVRTLSPSQRAALKVLARDVNVRLELRIQRKKLEKALREAEQARKLLVASEERFRLFMDNSPLASHIKDAEGRLVFYNQLFADRFGISRDEWIGKSNQDLWPAEEARRIDQADREVLEGKTLRAIRQSVHEKDGKVSCWKSYKFPLISVDGPKLMGVVGVEITEDLRREEELRHSQQELEILNQQLQNLARTDALTGLHNRRGFDERLRIEFAQAKRKKRALAVMLLDVDNFKRRNDCYGHPEGDKTLKLLGAVLQETVRVGDLVARYGGEEFVILLPETDEIQAMPLSERLLDAIRTQEWDYEPVTASLGVAALHPSMRDEQRLVDLADEALYAANRGGKDRAVSYGAYYQEVLQQIASGKQKEPEKEEGAP